MTRAKAEPAKKKALPPKTKPAAKVAAQAESPGSTTHRVDWEAVKRDFRTSRFTNVELCRKHSLDPATLSRRIKRDRENDSAAWPQDLSKAVKAATDARLMQELVKAEVKEGQQAVKLTVQAAAEVNAQVILAHRTRVRRATDVAMRMLDELDATTLDADKLEDLFKAATAEMAGPALNAARARFGELFESMVENIGLVIKGKDEVVRLSLTAMLADGHVKRLRYLAVGESFNVGQHDHDAVMLGQSGQRSIQILAQQFVEVVLVARAVEDDLRVIAKDYFILTDDEGEPQS